MEFVIGKKEDVILILSIFVADLGNTNNYFDKGLFIHKGYSLQAHHRVHLTSEECSQLLLRGCFFSTTHFSWVHSPCILHIFHQ